MGSLGRSDQTTLIVLFSLETLSFIWVDEDHYFSEIQRNSLELKSLLLEKNKLIHILQLLSAGPLLYKWRDNFLIPCSEDSNIRCYRKSLLTR